MDAAYIIGELITIGAMAFAFSMDSFSLGLGMGMLHLRLKRMALLSILSGLFHMFMPLIGIVIGKALSNHFGDIAVIAGGAMLIVIGLSMGRSAFKFDERHSIIMPYGIGLLLFPITVSLDSISAGLSLGIFGARVAATVALFGLMSTVLTMCGLLLGRKIHHFFGRYSIAMGGAILLAFGVKMLIPYVQ